MALNLRRNRPNSVSIAFKHLHKLKMPRGVLNTMRFATTKRLFETEEIIDLSSPILEMVVITSRHAIVDKSSQPMILSGNTGLGGK